MGLKSRAKGKRGEREVVALARAHGLRAERTWQTAQASDPAQRAKDVKIGEHFYQVQVEAGGFGRIYREMEGVQGFFFRRDRGEWLIALRATDYLTMLAETETGTHRTASPPLRERAGEESAGVVDHARPADSLANLRLADLAPPGGGRERRGAGVGGEVRVEGGQRCEEG